MPKSEIDQLKELSIVTLAVGEYSNPLSLAQEAHNKVQALINSALPKRGEDRSPAEVRALRSYNAALDRFITPRQIVIVGDEIWPRALEDRKNFELLLTKVRQGVAVRVLVISSREPGVVQILAGHS